MDSRELEGNFARNVRKMGADLQSDLREEVAHVTDPAQCGVVVQRHFDGLVFTLLAFVGGAVLTAVVLIWYFTHQG